MQEVEKNFPVLRIVTEMSIEERLRAITIPEEYLRPIRSSKKSKTESEHKG